MTDTPDHKPKMKCPHCERRLGGAHAMQGHLVAKHNLTTRQAHLIANPNDKQAIKARLPRMTPPQSPPDEVESFDVLEDF